MAARMMGLTVTLSHCPNPDVDGGYWDAPAEAGTARHVVVNSLPRAQEAVRDYIDRNGLGGGNWSGGDLRLDGRAIGRISYNCRAWHLDGTTAMDPADPVLGDYASKAKRKVAR